MTPVTSVLSGPMASRATALGLLWLLGGLALSCTESAKAPVVQPPRPVEAPASAPVPLPTLNQGRRWPANPETTQSVKAMHALVRQFAAQPAPRSEEVAPQLSAAFQTIFQRCTMTGEAHEQLHVFLVPMAEQLKRLEHADAATTGRVVRTLDTHLSQYSTFFE